GFGRHRRLRRGHGDLPAGELRGPQRGALLLEERARGRGAADGLGAPSMRAVGRLLRHVARDELELSAAGGGAPASLRSLRCGDPHHRAHPRGGSLRGRDALSERTPSERTPELERAHRNETRGPWLFRRVSTRSTSASPLASTTRDTSPT